MKHALYSVLFSCVMALALQAAPPPIGNYAGHTVSGRSVIITTDVGHQMRISPYGDYMVRVQVAESGIATLPTILELSVFQP